MRWTGGLVAVLLPTGYAPAFRQVFESGAMTCQRCGAVESGPLVLGIWFGTESPPTPGRQLVERVAGPCTPHRFESTGCWSSFRGVACTIRPTGDQAYELCVLAGGRTAERLAARLVERSAGERESILLQALPPDEFRVETPEAARRWITAVPEKKGWQDLEER